MWSVLHQQCPEGATCARARLNHVTRRHRNYAGKKNNITIPRLKFWHLASTHYQGCASWQNGFSCSRWPFRWPRPHRGPSSLPHQRIIGTRSGRQNLHNRGLGDGSQTARVWRVLTIVIASSVEVPSSSDQISSHAADCNGSVGFKCHQDLQPRDGDGRH